MSEIVVAVVGALVIAVVAIKVLRSGIPSVDKSQDEKDTGSAI